MIDEYNLIQKKYVLLKYLYEGLSCCLLGVFDTFLFLAFLINDLINTPVS